MDGFSKTTKSFAREASALGTSLTRTLTLSILGFGGVVAEAAIDFESSFAGIKKTVKEVTDSSGNLTDVGRQISRGMRDLAKEIPVNVNELNKVGQAAGQLGIKAENIVQ